MSVSRNPLITLKEHLRFFENRKLAGKLYLKISGFLRVRWVTRNVFKMYYSVGIFMKGAKDT